MELTDQRLALRSLRLAQVALDRSFTAILFVDTGGVVGYANQEIGRAHV